MTDNQFIFTLNLLSTLARGKQQLLDLHMNDTANLLDIHVELPITLKGIKYRCPYAASRIKLNISRVFNDRSKL